MTLFALTLVDLEVVVDLEVFVATVAATTGFGTALIPTAITLSLVTVWTSLPTIVMETSSPS
ncbi:hypothetical protein D3C74_503420 [compost metagenome]